MNSDASCHEIDGCPGVYVDAFRGRYAGKTQDPSCTFILTHYHGDHYGGLPKDGKYQGPAIIHCTPVTSSLLINVHGVPSQFVQSHDYGRSFRIECSGDEAKNDNSCRVTFFDANHCPGAAIVLFELRDGTNHLHTGDMRYHEKMKNYPALRKAVEKNRLDLVYLDTTYGHPKHEFVPQNEAVNTIASQVHDILGSSPDAHRDDQTLVLLSCYSIGKEKVLWESSSRSNQLVYVTEKKYRMLQCIEQHQDTDISSRIIERCTLDASKSDLHVIPMGMAGELWPFFQPNYQACFEYAQKLDKQYCRVVAFLPTGWAAGSNWNKKNAVSIKDIERDGRSMQVEIRLVCYSEHSAFSELCSFVEFLRPRKVVPTVFSDEKDRRRIEGCFRNMVDTKRAKQQFFKSMNSQQNKAQKAPITVDLSSCDDDGTKDVATVADQSTSESRKKRKHEPDSVSTLVAMGFDAETSKNALKRHGNCMERALDSLLTKAASPTKPKEQRSKTEKKQMQSTQQITRFFSPKST